MALRVISAVLWIIALNVAPAASIMNKKRNTSALLTPHFYPRREYFKKKSYLDGDRPLWVLQDKVNRPGEIEIATHRPFKSRRKFITPTNYATKLPSHYLNLHSAGVQPASAQSVPRNHKHIEEVTSHQSFPVFDGFEVDSDPILIYRGPKAEMIFNSMMTKRRYPMKEPVPGQVMYPPYSPKFKPTPVVEKVRSTKYPNSVFHNVTLIPFYAHEAIDPRQVNYETSLQPEEDSSFEDEDADDSQNYVNQEESPRYHSYYSQDEVQTKYWSLPYTTPPPIEDTTLPTLSHQLSVPNGFYPNHRMEATTPMPETPGSSFLITYDSETEGSSPKRYRSVHTAKYGGFKTLYPIYTLNKLLKYKPQKPIQKPARKTVIIKETKRKQQTKPTEETWLIWDSRHKGTHTSNYLIPTSTKPLLKNHHQTSAAVDTKILVQ